MPDGTPLAQVGFWDVFSALANGGLQLRRDLIISGQLFAAGAVVAPGQLLAGVDLFKRKGYPLAIEIQENRPYILRGFYPPIS